MESVYLKTLVAVARTGSLSRAAETLCVTQPAVSRRIKFLEEQYGQLLLDRTGPQVRLTDAGRLVVQKAQALLEIESELEAGLHRLSGKTRLSFGSTQAFGIAHLPKILSTFMLDYGDSAELKFMFLTPNEILRGIQEGMVDLAVLEGALPGDDLMTLHPLPEADMVFFSAPELGIPSPGASIEALLERPLFTRREGCCSRMLLERGLHAMGLGLESFRSLIVLDDLHLLMKSVMDGTGVSFMPLDLLAEPVRAGRARIHFVPGFRHARARVLAVNQGSGASAAIDHLARIILEYFASTESLALLNGPVSQGFKPPMELASGAPDFCCGMPAPAPGHL
jgi:DNA-binding transcriptional LysR family regulator